MADILGNKTISQLTQGVEMQPTDVFPADKSQGDTVKFTIAQIEAYVKNSILEEMTDLTGQTLYLNYDAGLVYGNLLKMDGRSVLKTDYPELFAKIGYTWGGADDSFTLPDHVDRFAAMAGTQIAQNYLVSQNKTHTHEATFVGKALPSHKHNIPHYDASDKIGSGIAGGPTTTEVTYTQMQQVSAGTPSGTVTVQNQGSSELRPKTIRQYAYIQYKKF